jgi:hypothetical protein
MTSRACWLFWNKNQWLLFHLFLPKTTSNYLVNFGAQLQIYFKKKTPPCHTAPKSSFRDDFNDMRN